MLFTLFWKSKTLERIFLYDGKWLWTQVLFFIFPPLTPSSLPLPSTPGLHHPFVSVHGLYIYIYKVFGWLPTHPVPHFPSEISHLWTEVLDGQYTFIRFFFNSLCIAFSILITFQSIHIFPLTFLLCSLSWNVFLQAKDPSMNGGCGPHFQRSWLRKVSLFLCRHTSGSHVTK